MGRKLFVVIPVHNRKEATRGCLDCLRAQTYPALHTVLVDDGSTDGTREMLESDFPEVIRLEGNGNLFWTGATNLGIQYALEHSADLIVTLNNDVKIRPDYIEKLVAAHRGHPQALIGSMNLTQEEPLRLLYAGVESLNPWTAKCIKRGTLPQVYRGEFEGLLSTCSLPGRGTLIPRGVFEEIGLFDEKHFRHYAADQDFSLRAKAAGFDLLLNADNPVYSPYEEDRTGAKAQSIRSFLKSFFTMRSCNYLPVLIRYNLRYHPCKVYAPVFTILDIGRRVFGFVGKKMRCR